MHNIEHHISIFVAKYLKNNQYHKLIYW